MSRTLRGGQSPRTARAAKLAQFHPNESALEAMTVDQLRARIDELPGLSYKARDRKADLIEILMEVGE